MFAKNRRRNILGNGRYIRLFPWPLTVTFFISVEPATSAKASCIRLSIYGYGTAFRCFQSKGYLAGISPLPLSYILRYPFGRQKARLLFQYLPWLSRCLNRPRWFPEPSSNWNHFVIKGAFPVCADGTDTVFLLVTCRTEKLYGCSGSLSRFIG